MDEPKCACDGDEYALMMRPLTDEEGEVRELTEEDFEGMRPLAEVDPGMLEAVREWRKVCNSSQREPKRCV